MPLTSRISALRQKFISTFGDGGRKIALVRAPGRINLIGEHTDYNEGYVLPAAVNKAVFVAAQRRTDTQVNIFSSLFDEKITFDSRTLQFNSDHGWANYPKGVISVLTNRGWKIEGINIYVESDVPLGSGMSSSAALECATAWACLSLYPYQLTRLEMAKACQNAENRFVGVQCGIMDQFASAFGKKGHAIFLDCRTLSFEHVPLSLDKHSIVIINSRVKRKLASGEYNKRREQCTEAVKLLKTANPKIRALRDLENENLDSALGSLPPLPRKRAEHVARECRRTREAMTCLKKGDLARFGHLMNESHESLRDLFEVSCPELDVLAESAQSVKGVLGARMMGGGFGGCVIALAEKGAVEDLKRETSKTYQKRFATHADIYEVETDDGTAEYTA